jgi:2-oxoglutarate ferredoxin oxidoreductase subunit beta
VTRQAPALKNVIKAGLSHVGFSFIEVMSDCTEIYGRKNDLGESPEMILAQKSDMRPEAFGNVADEPFRPNRLRAGILVQRDRPEYGRVWRQRVAAERAKAQANA